MTFDSILPEANIYAAYRSFTIEIPNPPSDLTRTYIEYSYSLDNSVFSDWIPLVDLDSSVITYTHKSLGVFNEFAEHRDVAVPPDIFADPTPLTVVNPSFTTNTSNWYGDNSSILTRDTSSFDTTPASLNVQPAGSVFTGGMCHGDVSGVFHAGETYSLTFKYVLTALALTGASMTASLGQPTDKRSVICPATKIVQSSQKTPLTGTDGGSPATGFDQPWTNPGNITTTNFYATCPGPGAKGLGGSHYIQATNFGFQIPGTATIEGISVFWLRHQSASSQGAVTYGVQLVKNGVTQRTLDTTSGGIWSTSDSAEHWGSEADMSVWGTTLTPSDVNASNFGFNLEVQFTGGITTASVTFMGMTVNYTVPGAFNTQTISWSPRTTITNTTVSFTSNDAAETALSLDSFNLAQPPSVSDLQNIYQTYDPATLQAANTIPIYYRYRYRIVTRSGDSDWSDLAYAGQVRTITSAEIEDKTVGVDHLTDELRALLGL